MDTAQGNLEFLREAVTTLVAECVDGGLLDLIYKLLLSSSIG